MIHTVQCHDAKVIIKTDRESPREHIAVKPVHAPNQANEATDHPHTSNIGAQDQVRAVDHPITEEVFE